MRRSLACGRPRSIGEELLRAFVAVQDVGSISRAAPKLGYSQPGLSHLVQSLERIVGHLLFVRGAKGVSLTTEGAIVLTHDRSILETTETLRNELAEGTDGGQDAADDDSRPDA